MPLLHAEHELYQFQIKTTKANEYRSSLPSVGRQSFQRSGEFVQVGGGPSVQTDRMRKRTLADYFFGNVGGWHHDRLPGLVLDIRDALEAFKAAVEAGEVTGFKNGGMRVQAICLF
jgi:hypothetical protein